MSLLPFQAWDDFDTYTIGTNVVGHTLRGGGAPTYKPRSGSAAILPYKKRYLEFLTDATTDYHAVTVDAVDADANRATFDIVFSFSMSLCTVEELHVYARGAGTGTMTDFLRARIVLASGAIAIDKMVGSAYTAGAGLALGYVALTADHSYIGRFRGNGGTISLRIWDATLGRYLEPATTPAFLLPGVAGNFATSPDSVAASITGDIDLRVMLAMNDWTPAAIQYVLAKYNGTTQGAYLLSIGAAGTIGMEWVDSGGTLRGAASTVATGFTDLSTRWIRATLDVDNGAAGRDIKFYTSVDGVTWTQLGTTVTQAGTTTIKDGTDLLTVGAYGNTGAGGPTSGTIYRALVYNGIAGTVVADFNPGAYGAPGATTMSSVTGEVWTINSSGTSPASIFARTSWDLKVSGMTPTAAGWIGVGGRHSTLTGKVAAFNFVQVATHARNLLESGDDFNDALWTNTTAWVVPNAINSPVPSSLYYKLRGDLIINVGGSGSRRTQAFVATATSQCYSVYVHKSVGASVSILLFNSTTATTLANISLNFDTGVQSIVTGSANAVVALPDGWYRVSIYATAGITIGNTLISYVYAGLTSSGAGDAVYASEARVDDGTTPLAFEIAAPCPRTNTERTAWLNGTVLPGESGIRAVLAKMRSTGYDSSGAPYTATRKAYFSNFGYHSAAQDTPALQPYDNYIIGVPSISREMPVSAGGIATLNIGKLRLSNPAALVPGGAYLLLPGTAGAYASTPDSAAASITGDIDLRADLSLVDWTPSVVQEIISKNATDSTDFSYLLRLDVGGGITLYWSLNGTTLKSASSVGAPVVADGGRIWIRATLDVDNGAGGQDARFYYSTNGGTTWIAIGGVVTVATAGNIFDSAALPKIGARGATGSGGPANGTVYRAQIYNGIAGTLAVDFNLSGVVKGTPSFSGPLGEVWTINGTAKILQNEDKLPGVRDDLLREHWQRDGLEVIMLDPTWPVLDGIHVLRGRLGAPTAPSLGVIEFPITDMSEFLNKRLVSTRIASGDWATQYKAKIWGLARAIELVGDHATLVYYISDGALNPDLDNDGFPHLMDVTPAAFSHIGTIAGLTVTAVNTITGEITASANHGMVNGYRLRYPSGTPPLSLLNNTNYWIVGTTPGTDKYKLSLTQGGAAITGGGSSTGAPFNGFGYTFDTTNGTVTLAASPVGRIICMNAADLRMNSGLHHVSGVLYDMVFNALGLSLNYFDSANYDAAVAVDVADGAYTGYHMKVGAGETGSAVIPKILTGMRAWLSMAPDGMVQMGSVALPSATPVASYGVSDVKEATLRMTDSVRNVDFSKAVVTSGPWFLVGGPVNTPGVNISGVYNITSQESMQGKQPIDTTVSPWTDDTSPPLDNYAAASDADQAFTFDSYGYIFTGDVLTRLLEFHRQKLGTFEFETTLPAIERSIGETISLEFPRLGFKQWTAADPASPDNTATIDSRNCTIIGHYLKVNAAGSSYDGVGLKVSRRLPGYYRTSNFN